MIPYSTQYIDENDIEAVSKALEGEYLTCGPLVNEFENRFAAYVGAKYAVAVSSGTAALHAAFAVAGVTNGSEVITTPNTWVSSACAAFYCGGKPVFADINCENYNIDSLQIEKKITKNTRAIVPVHYAGQPCCMDEIHEIAKENGLIVIEDAAHAVGASYKGRKIGSLSDMTVFSFHPVKQMTTCEGGMVTTNNKDFYEQLRKFRSYGMVKETTQSKKEGPWFSDQETIGYNYRLSDVQCALGISQLEKIERLIARRRAIAEIYDQEFKDCGGIVPPRGSHLSESSFHLYPILVDRDKRKELYFKLREAGIGVGVHYYPVYKNSYYQANGYRDVYCPNSEEFYERELSLPIHFRLKDEEVEYIIKTAKALIRQG